MLRKQIYSQDIKVFNSAILPVAALLLTNVISPFVKYIVHNSPSEHSQLMVPAAAQGTGYLVAPQPRKRM